MNSSLIFSAISFISVVSVLVPLIVGVVRLRSLNLAMKVLFIYIVVSTLTETLNTLFFFISKENYIVRNSFTLLETFFISWIYFIKFQSRRSRVSITLLFAGYLILAFYMLVIRHGFNQPDNVMNTVEAWFFIILTGLYFKKVITEINDVNISEPYFIWINSAFLLYFSMGFFLFLFTVYLEKCGLQQYYYLYSLHLVTNIAFNIILAIGVWKAHPR